MCLGSVFIRPFPKADNLTDRKYNGLTGRILQICYIKQMIRETFFRGEEKRILKVLQLFQLYRDCTRLVSNEFIDSLIITEIYVIK